MFDVTDYVKDAECVNCEKVTECLAVCCKLGTLAGNLCVKCLLKQAKLRAGAKKDPLRPAASD